MVEKVVVHTVTEGQNPSVIAQFVFPFHFYYNMYLSNVKKNLSTGIGILLDFPISFLNLCSPIITTILCLYLMSRRNLVLGLESFHIP